jgi:hypothetical protein
MLVVFGGTRKVYTKVNDEFKKNHQSQFDSFQIIIGSSGNALGS